MIERWGGAAAERFARFFGTVEYLLIQTVVIVVWMVLNTLALLGRWDPFPFILLNLVFSAQAAYAAPMILLAQNRQADRTAAQEHADAEHREEIAARHQETLEAIHDLCRLDTPGGLAEIYRRIM